MEENVSGCFFSEHSAHSILARVKHSFIISSIYMLHAYHITHCNHCFTQLISLSVTREL